MTIHLINLFIYIVFLLGIMFVESDSFLVLAKRHRLRHRLSGGGEEGRIISWCSSLMSGAFGRNIDGVWLIAGEIAVFTASFVITVRTFTFMMSLMIAAVISLFPLLIIFSRLKSIQERSSKEAVSLITEFYRQYRINDLNIFSAIEETIDCSGDYPICRKQLSVLLIRLRDSAGRKTIKENCRRFGFAIGGTWGKMLSSCIEIAAINGTDISAALEDIVDQIKENKTRLEERKRLNGEAMRMTLFLVPLLYAGTILASVKYLGIGFTKLLHNQFYTSEGVMFFIICVFLFFTNVLVLSLVNNGRGDL